MGGACDGQSLFIDAVGVSHYSIVSIYSLYY